MVTPTETLHEGVIGCENDSVGVVIILKVFPFTVQ